MASTATEQTLLRIRVRGVGSFHCAPAQTIVEAGNAAGFGFPVACRNGVCERCQGTLEQGSVRIARKDLTVNAGEAAASRVLYCVAHPLTDCEIAVPDVTAPGHIPEQELACQVLAIEPLNHDVSRVTLRLPAGRSISWHAGQYLLLHDNEPAAFSIANASTPGNRDLELHIRHTEDNPSSLAIMQRLANDSVVRATLPLGRRYLDHVPERPLWFICGSTGYAPAQAMLEYLSAAGCQQPVRLFWGARQKDDLYLHEQASTWQQKLANARYLPALSDQQAEGFFHGMVHEAALAELTELGDSKAPLFYIGGSPPMAWAVFDALVAAGVTPAQIHSDVFDYAPR